MSRRDWEQIIQSWPENWFQLDLYRNAPEAAPCVHLKNLFVFAFAVPELWIPTQIRVNGKEAKENT